MSNARYSRSEKGKWAAGPSRPVRKPPIIIPASNNAELIEENRLTLIGRVTNPSVQKTRALVDFFLQHWHVVGTITGRPLGPHMFQFMFETEHDLLSVLDKAPFHFKRWMLILQRWEPVVSDSFPSLIPFWINIHGIPLHYWTDEALNAIGAPLGPIIGKEAKKGRIRIQINGLQPLEMNMEISLPSGETKQVELEYEKLDKHCFICFSLSHEKDDCPSNRASSEHPSPRVGISQSRTLERIEDGRRRLDERRQARYMPYADTRRPALRPDRTTPRSSNEYSERDRRSYTPYEPPRRYGDTRRSHDREHSGRSHPLSPSRHSASLHTPSQAIRSHDSRAQSGSHRSVWRQVQNPQPAGTPNHSIQSQISHTPSPKPHREEMQPLEQRQAEGSGKGDRRSALERLSAPMERVPLLINGVANSDSGRLQEVEIQYFEDTMSPHLIGSGSRPSSSKNPPGGFSAPRAVMQADSPIRTLSEDRLHVSLRLGPCPASASPVENIQLEGAGDSLTAATTKAAGKRKYTRTAPKAGSKAATKASTRAATKPGARGAGKKKPPSPIGISLRQRRATRCSPKRRLDVDAPSGPSTAEAQDDGAQPTATLIPAIKKRGSGFRTAQRSLP